MDIYCDYTKDNQESLQKWLLRQSWPVSNMKFATADFYSCKCFMYYISSHVEISY